MGDIEFPDRVFSVAETPQNTPCCPKFHTTRKNPLFAQATPAANVSRPSRLPSFSHHAESIGKHGNFREHDSEPLDQRQQPRLRHIGDQIVEHAALSEQGVSAPFGGV